MRDALWIDLETRSKINLKTQGAGLYTRHCEIIVVSYAIGDGPVQIWEPLRQPRPDMLADGRLRTYKCLIAHNGNGFDRPILERVLGFPTTLVWYDSAIKAAAHNYPRSLGALAEYLGLAQGKKAGHHLIRLFCIPNTKGQYNDWRSHPREWAEFIDYARVDVEVMRHCWAATPSYNYPSNKFECSLVEHDYRINQRGFRIDVPFAASAVRILKDSRTKANEKLAKMTNGAVTAVTQTARLLKHIQKIMPEMHSLAKKEREDNYSEDVQELLDLRDGNLKTSTAKYTSALSRVDADGVIRGAFMVYGARTGRWGAGGFQPQNLPRYDTTIEEQTLFKAAVRSGNFDLLDTISNGSVHAALSNHLRSLIIPREGKIFYITDFSNIEGRVLAWLAGEFWKLKAFADFDAGKGPDIYRSTYARVFGCPLSEVDGAARQIGKTIELACGYQGAVGALSSACALSGLPEFGETEAVAIIQAWRKEHPATRSFWYNCDAAFKDAVAGRTTKVRYLAFGKIGDDVAVKLPSGRYLVLPRAGIDSDGLAYYMLGKRKIYTYGGKTVENVTQAVSRDLLADTVTATGDEHDIAMHLHDELVYEVFDDGMAAAKGQAIDRSATRTREWVGATGLPLAAKGFLARIYRKG